MSGKSYDAESRFIPPSTLSPAGGSKTVPGRLRKEGTRRGTAKKISLPPTDCALPSHRHVFARRTVAARSRGQAQDGTRGVSAVHAIKLHGFSFCRDREAWDRRFIPNEFASRHAKTIAPWPPDAQSPLGRSFGGLSFSGMPSRKLLRRSPGQSSRQRAPPHGARAHRRGRTRRPRPPCPSKTS